MEMRNVNRLRMQDFPNRSYYCIMQKFLPSGYPLHRHDFFEIEIVLSGNGLHHLNGTIYPLRRGCVYFLNLNDFHEITVGEPLEVLTLMFSDHWVKDPLLYQMLCSESDLQCILAEKEIQQFLLITDMMRTEYLSDQPMRDTMLQNLTESLLIQHIRACGICSPHMLSDTESPVTRVILYLNAHFRENPSLCEVAAMVNHNCNYFSELFHKTVGQSYIQYLNSLKLNYARRLLSSTDQSVIDVSAASGFNSYSGFSHAFRQNFGCSAKEFREKQREHKRQTKR